MERILEIKRRIKEFTFLSPTDRGLTDTSYIRYLATCSKLLDLDVSLNALQNDDDMEYEEFMERLLNIEQDVIACTKWLIKD